MDGWSANSSDGVIYARHPEFDHFTRSWLSFGFHLASLWGRDWWGGEPLVAMALVVCGDKGHHVTVISNFHGLPLFRAIVFHLNIHGSTVVRQFSIDQQHECTGKQIDNKLFRHSGGNGAPES